MDAWHADEYAGPDVFLVSRCTGYECTRDHRYLLTRDELSMETTAAYYDGWNDAIEARDHTH